jgi:hypothetical protein
VGLFTNDSEVMIELMIGGIVHDSNMPIRNFEILQQ